MLCFILEMQVFKLYQNFVLWSKCEHFGTPCFYHAISLCHFDTCCMKYSWKLINSAKISFSLFLYLEKCAFENGRKWASPRHCEGVANLKSSYFQKYKRYWAKIFSVKLNHVIQHLNTFWANLKRVELGHYEKSGRLAWNDPYPHESHYVAFTCLPHGMLMRMFQR